MRRAGLRRRSNTRLSANFTPLIDVLFQLIIFFLLVMRVNERQIVKLQLPRPTDAAGASAGPEQRMVLNLVGRGDDPAVIASIRADGLDFGPDRDGRQALSSHLANRYASSPSLRLDVRADRRLQYRYVEPVLRAVADGAALGGTSPHVNLVIERDGSRTP